MECPFCGKEMKQGAVDTFSLLNPMVMAEECECECGVVYQFLEGAERFLKNGEEFYINDIKVSNYNLQDK